jgi:hypothetical protein
MPHLILVSPHFPPTNAPDHQRVRQSLPYWRELGWSVEVLAVVPEHTSAPLAPFLVSLIPGDVPVHRVNGLGLGWRMIPGLGILGYRVMLAIHRKLVNLVSQHPDNDHVVVYFSTTQFPVHNLIPRLKKEFPGLTVVMDFQDPWFSTWYAQNPHVVPPGGRLKFWLGNQLDRYFEKKVLGHIDGITTVSKDYRENICARLPWFRNVPWIELPFGGAEADFNRIRELGIKQQIFNAEDGNLHWVYVGRGGPYMEKSARAICRALKSRLAVDPVLQRVRMHFIGTDYAEARFARKELEYIANEEGVGDIFFEYPERVSYAIALQCLMDAHAILMPGSTDSAYSASKLYPCILARRPLLAVFHRNSPVHRILAETKAGTAVAFDNNDSTDQLASAITQAWLEPGFWQVVPDTDWAGFEQYTDRGMTRKLSEFLTAVSREP